MIGPIVLVSLGLTAEVLGVLLIANKFTKISRWYRLPMLLFSALVRGKTARGVDYLEKLNPQGRLTELQGLALLGLGFLLQTIGFLWSALSAS